MRELNGALNYRGKHRRADSPEKREQRWVIDCFMKAGMRVYSLSQPRATMQTEGFADLWVFCPRRRRAFWWETKSPAALKKAHQGMSPEQRIFQALCQQTQVGYYVGDLLAARALLGELGLTWNPADR